MIISRRAALLGAAAMTLCNPALAQDAAWPSQPRHCQVIIDGTQERGCA